jgi:staphyloferrin B biosynthesis citrate synthase
LRENRLKTMMRKGEPAIGSWVTLSDPSVVELLGLAGCDFVIIDVEHASLDYQTVENMIRAADAVGTIPLVRVGQNQENNILRVVESGAQGVIIPHVMDRDAAERAVRYTKYEPLGIRGISAMTRASRWTMIDFVEHVRTSNEQTMVIPMVEDVEGIENIEEILQVDGVDVVFIGPADLARSYGVTTDTDPAPVRDAIDYAAAVAKRLGKARLGLPMYHPAFNRTFSQLVQMESYFITYSTDAAEMARSFRANLRKARQS